MRLWHEALIPFISTQRLLGQHRECCALRGNGWGRKQSTVNYVFDHPYADLYSYHLIVMMEMAKRKINFNNEWLDIYYRGKNCNRLSDRFVLRAHYDNHTIYPEHNAEYLKFCTELLNKRGDKSWNSEITK